MLWTDETETWIIMATSTNNMLGAVFDKEETLPDVKLTGGCIIV